MSDGIIIALITASGALLLGVINMLVGWRQNSRKERKLEHHQLIQRLESIEKNQEHNSNGTQALLRYELYELWGACQKKGYADEMNRTNFLNLYEKYHNIGVNGVMDNVKTEFLKLPVRKPSKPRALRD